MSATIPASREAIESDATRAPLRALYAGTRSASQALCEPLSVDDYGLQAAPNVSPPKWHLAHTTWFFETFLLNPFLPRYREFHPQFAILFNSYYQTIGPQYPRPSRGLLSRPTREEVRRYRRHVDAAMDDLLSARTQEWSTIAPRIALGCHHEQQHQELLLTDVKYNFSVNPLRPSYRADLPVAPARPPAPLRWFERPAGLYEIGHAGGGFLFDNEQPRHGAYLPPHALASRLVTNGEYLEFIEAGGYRRPELWLADGWKTVVAEDWQAPLYWEQIDGRWWNFTLAGMRPLAEHEPVCHVSFYEADAYARFMGRRLPREAEWEALAATQRVSGNLRDRGYLHPIAPISSDTGPAQLFGDVWEWTQSAYSPYPGYRAPDDALGEYNGKFMINQLVLRGGSCVTPADHIRPTYRNFFYPADRWQFSGIRLAADR